RETERRRPGVPHEARGAVGREEDGRGVTGAGEAEPPRREVELAVDEGRRGGAGGARDERVERVQDAGGADAGGGDGPDGAAQLAHRDRGVEATADDVPDDDGEDVVVEVEGVVPVATDLKRLDARQVRRGHGDALVL